MPDHKPRPTSNISGRSFPIVLLFMAVFWLALAEARAQGDGRGTRSSQHRGTSSVSRGYQTPTVPWYAKPLAEREAILRKYQVPIVAVSRKSTEEGPNQAPSVQGLQMPRMDTIPGVSQVVQKGVTENPAKIRLVDRNLRQIQSIETKQLSPCSP
jgi:hypothetical protein